STKQRNSSPSVTPKPKHAVKPPNVPVSGGSHNLRILTSDRGGAHPSDQDPHVTASEGDHAALRASYVGKFHQEGLQDDDPGVHRESGWLARVAGRTCRRCLAASEVLTGAVSCSQARQVLRFGA